MTLAYIGVGVLIGNPISGVILGKDDWTGLVVLCGSLLVVSGGIITVSRIMKSDFETIAIHGGREPDGSRVVPIFQTTSYIFDDAADGATKYSWAKESYLYSRLENPTTSVFEKRMAMLGGGVGAVATASGHSAQFTAVTQYCQHKLAIPAITAVAHEHGIPPVVDNTFGMAGYLCQPVKHGADIVTHSCTKWIGGHNTSMDGVVIDGGRFQWGGPRLAAKFPGFTDPTPGYHGMRFWETNGELAGSWSFHKSIQFVDVLTRVGNITYARSADCRKHTKACRIVGITPMWIKGGVSPDLWIVSVGIESIEDIKRDFEQAFPVASLKPA
ncbi:hypothetical protein O1611_g5667 [Lasiodiplodia mahajangana]|uniref:Uncharacterized protein n=1 Tax=Lasiodiplodia mahajangana TaxID=1108764 RepID=A0ACC2JKD5_9PEZI|nr:hypothetical protein O1611_g5667 [Lasiodiplodia mahajangana]